MACLLLNSPLYREHSEVIEDYLPPLGLAYIATQLNSAGINTEIVDCVKERRSIENIFALLVERQPKYIGTNLFTQNYEIVKELVEKCPVKATIIIGGKVTNNLYSDILTWNVENKLLVIVGEGELILPAIITGSCSESPTMQKENKFIYTVHADSVYFPVDLNCVSLDRTLLKDDAYVNPYKQREKAIITSRGCPYDCAFCGGAKSVSLKGPIRRRNTTDIKSELSAIKLGDPTVSSIRVLDDLFLGSTRNVNEAIELFNAFPTLSWRGMAHILTFYNSGRLLNSLKLSGCQELFIGIESGSERIRGKINKRGTVAQIIDVVSAILDAGIDVKGYFMFGFPSETLAEADETYKLALRLSEISKDSLGRFRTSVFQFRPYHGTQLYDEIIKSGRVIPYVTSNKDLNSIEGRTQFNFQSGNYSSIPDKALYTYILNTQKLIVEY